jgi:hypothetical protein
MLSLVYTLDDDACRAHARRFPWKHGAAAPPWAHLECHGLHDGVTIFFVTLHNRSFHVKTRAVTAESALCQALAAWGVQQGDVDAPANADALRRRLAN